MSSSKMKKKTSSAVFPLPMDDSMVDVAAAKKINLPLFVSVKVACILALFGACLLAASSDYSLINSPCNPADSSCIDLTDAAGAKVEALERAQLWVSGVQAVAALLGLLLSGHCSLVLAYVALTVGAANLCMEAVVDAIFIAAAPGNHSLKMDSIAYDVFFAVLDLIGFIVLILGQLFPDEE